LSRVWVDDRELEEVKRFIEAGNPPSTPQPIPILPQPIPGPDHDLPPTVASPLEPATVLQAIGCLYECVSTGVLNADGDCVFDCQLIETYPRGLCPKKPKRKHDLGEYSDPGQDWLPHDAVEIGYAAQVIAELESRGIDFCCWRQPKQYVHEYYRVASDGKSLTEWEDPRADPFVPSRPSGSHDPNLSKFEGR
jgi:hypothetical protein